MIRVQDLDKDFGTGRGAVNYLSLDIPDGSFFSLVGPSGCGKTTTLRCIAGLEEPNSGKIEISGVTVYSSADKISLPPQRRSVGMVFQTYAIWPHMTVYQNVAYPLKTLRWSRREIDSAVSDALEMVGLRGESDRPAPLLSGGQQQRVALARALVARPRVLLLDEPLSNLDAKLRAQMRIELRDLHRSIGFTALYVTHDQDEAFALSDVMAVMNAGRIVELGAPDQLYRSPTTAFGAAFLGTATEISGRVVRDLRPQALRIETTIGELSCRMDGPAEPGAEVRVYVRPEDITVIPAEDGFREPEAIAATLSRIMVLGGVVDYWVEVSGVQLRARVLASESVVQFLSDHLDRPIGIRLMPTVAQAVDRGNDDASLGSGHVAAAKP